MNHQQLQVLTPSLFIQLSHTFFEQFSSRPFPRRVKITSQKLHKWRQRLLSLSPTDVILDLTQRGEFFNSQISTKRQKKNRTKDKQNFLGSNVCMNDANLLSLSLGLF